ncbi:hypothetical protein [Vibrio minamisatsumaniensis]|uniref:hypothetical protein n=1 Tax=Vibrio minamisatsumaniensis TaxID=2910243 RepID=UPI003D210715
MNEDNQYICPPGTDYSIVATPDGNDRAMEVALMKEHRFAFYYWFKWHKIKAFGTPPALISIDWHQDLCAPCESEKNELIGVDLNSFFSVARFSWDGLNSLNDGHILAAAYLNLIGNVYVLCKQEIHEPTSVFLDAYGNEHTICCFEHKKDLIAALNNSAEDAIYLDIDLDYFTECSDPCGGGENLTVMSQHDIENVIDPRSDLMCWCFERMQGLTIATEPTFCGGLRNSNSIFNTIDSKLFSLPLLGSKVEWSHLST